MDHTEISEYEDAPTQFLLGRTDPSTHRPFANQRLLGQPHIPPQLMYESSLPSVGTSAFPPLASDHSQYPVGSTLFPDITGPVSTLAPTSTTFQYTAHGPSVSPNPLAQSRTTPQTTAVKNFRPPVEHSGDQELPHPYHKSYLPSQSRSLVIDIHDFVVKDSVMISSDASGSFMKEFAEHTISGAAFDDSARDYPPRCHPGTRLAILEHLQKSIAVCDRDKRVTWLVGPAGVGKSAIMQTLAETAHTLNVMLGASLFFSINGRTDGSKTLTTLAYQIAVKSQPYREFIGSQVSNDATLWNKSITTQFNKFIFEPFVVRGIRPEGHNNFLILIDGLDECNDQRTQCEILGLISYFSIKYPAAPLVWVIASRPEPHITNFLSCAEVAPAFRKEILEIDSDEARADVERYLRSALGKLRLKYPTLARFSRWPPEREFMKVAGASSGLFAHASTVVAYVDDPTHANPVSHFQQVLDVIDKTHSQEEEGSRHPLANLDALYALILSRIPGDVLVDTKKLLLAILPIRYHPNVEFLPFLCNWLGMTPDTAYGSLHHLHSVLDIPPPEEARKCALSFRHKSFRDYLRDFARSGMYLDYEREVEELHSQCICRIVKEMPKTGSGSNLSTDISLYWTTGHDSEDLLQDKDMVYFGMLDSLCYYENVLYG